MNLRLTGEVILWELMSMTEMLAQPVATRAFRMGESAFDRQVNRQIRLLEREAFLERQPGGKRDRLYRLTEKGRLAALGGIDPEREWTRPWDGLWRFFCFDMPADRAKERVRLWRALKGRRFGCLQGSIWISPDSAEALRRELSGDVHPESLAIMEGRPAGSETDRQFAKSAWDFAEISDRWKRFEALVAKGQKDLKSGSMTLPAFQEWAGTTRKAWGKVVEADPFLPDALLPSNYTGRKIWRRKEKTFHEMRKLLERRGGLSSVLQTPLMKTRQAQQENMLVHP